MHFIFNVCTQPTIIVQSSTSRDNRWQKTQIVKKERASAVEAMIANKALQGKMDSKVTEGQLIEMLEGIVGAQQQKQGDAGKISIQRKRYGFDSDSDDNDDDLL